MGKIKDVDVGDGKNCNCLLCQMNRILLAEAEERESSYAREGKSKLGIPDLDEPIDDLDAALETIANSLNTGTGFSTEVLATILRAHGYDETQVAEEENENEPIEPYTDVTFDFSYALRFLKDGYEVTRAGWNGRGQYISMIDPNGENPFGIGGASHLTLLPWLGIKTVDDCFVPWLASQTDLMAEDWMVLL